uniref:Uncharacterized protein n=1 Tax=Oryza punctata TaxID=4537 RepID=A0A0E0JHQ3_ORYPU
MSIDDMLSAILKKLEMLDVLEAKMDNMLLQEDSMTSFGDGLTSDTMAPAISSTRIVGESEKVVDKAITSLAAATSTQPFPLAAFAMEQEVTVQQKMEQSDARSLAVSWGSQPPAPTSTVIAAQRPTQPLRNATWARFSGEMALFPHASARFLEADGMKQCAAAAWETARRLRGT